jgi:hypothetical protein
MSEQALWVIWSFEHDAWWRPDRCGYAHDLHRAGRYTQSEAAAIVADANIVGVNEVALHEAEAELVVFNSVRRAMRALQETK